MWIGISGKMGVGKDYIVNNNLSKLYDKNIIISFADMIKINLMVHNNIKLHELYGDKTPEIRQLLQYEGTENGRDKYGQDIWIKYVKSWGELYLSRGYKYIIVTDVRFKNEYDFIKNNNGSIIRIEAPKRNEQRLRNESSNEEEYNKIKNHISEIDLDNMNFDIIINNDIK
jgi:hypothetical protein